MYDEDAVVFEAKTDPQAFGRLYDTYYQPVFGFLLGRTGNVEVAKDLASETFFQALKNITKYKPRGKAFKSWLFAIAVAQIGNFYRKRAKVLPVTLDECPELAAGDFYHADHAILESEEAQIMRERAALLRRLMRSLNQKQQNVLTLRYFSKQTIPEIAAVLKMKEGTVKSHIHRALKKLHVLMNDEETQKEAEYTYEPATQSRGDARAHGIA